MRILVVLNAKNIVRMLILNYFYSILFVCSIFLLKGISISIDKIGKSAGFLPFGLTKGWINLVLFSFPRFARKDELVTETCQRSKPFLLTLILSISGTN